jgi:O-antigen/teichoic acid export membrane protein
MNVGTKIIAFLMLPIYTNYLSPTEYGALDYIDKISSMLTFIIIFGTDSALSYYYFDAKDEGKKLKYVQNVMWFRIFIVLILTLTLLLGGQWLSEQLLDSERYVNLFYLMAGILFLDTIIVVVLTVLRFTFHTKKVVVYTVLKMLLIAILSYLFLKFIITSPEAIFLGRIISSGIILIFLLSVSIKYLKPKLNREILKEILKYAAPLVPASIAFWVIANSSTLILKEFSSLEEVGIYGAAMKLATVITLITSGVQMAWRPYSMSIKDNDNSPILFSKIYMLLLVVGSVSILIVATFMPYIIKILNQDYYEAYKFVALIAVSTFLNFFYLIISVGLFFKKQTAYISIAFGVVAVVNFILNMILIPLVSIWGAVIAYLLSYIVAVVLIFIKSQKVYHVPVNTLKMILVFLAMLISVIAVTFIQEFQINKMYIALVWAGFIFSIALLRIDKEMKKKMSMMNQVG